MLVRVKTIALLGSTGSIGQNALKIIQHLGDGYEVVALAARQNIDLLEQQIATFQPKLVAVFDEKQALELKRRCPNTAIVAGMEGVCEVATHPEANLVISAMAAVYPARVAAKLAPMEAMRIE